MSDDKNDLPGIPAEEVTDDPIPVMARDIAGIQGSIRTIYKEIMRIEEMVKLSANGLRSDLDRTRGEVHDLNLKLSDYESLLVQKITEANKASAEISPEAREKLNSNMIVLWVILALLIAQTVVALLA